MLSDYDEDSNSRQYAFECCDYSNTEEDESSITEETKSCSMTSESKSWTKTKVERTFIKSFYIES